MSCVLLDILSYENISLVLVYYKMEMVYIILNLNYIRGYK